jgi:hypothetical protein
MVLGLLLIAMLAGTLVSVLLFAASEPLWLVLLAYPVTGSVTMLLAAIVLASLPGRRQPAAQETALSAPCPAPQR